MTDLQKHISERLGDKVQFTTQELISVLNELNPTAAQKTHSWKIYQMVQEGFLHKIGRGLYSFEFKPTYYPDLSLKAKRIHNRIKSFYTKELVVWETTMLNDFCTTNNEHHWIFFHATKDELDSLFHNLLDFSKKSFIQPDIPTINRYLLPSNEAIILVPLLSETPIFESGDYLTPSIEAILVNSWIKYSNYLKPIGYDINEIFKTAFSNYNINQSKLLRFAARRDRRKEINELIKILNKS